MHLRISTLLCCAILTGFANSSQSSTDRTYNDGIDIDADLEGSGGGGKEVSRDLVEASGSGHGPSPYDDDDEDHNHVEVVKKIASIETTLAPIQKIPNSETIPKSTDFDNTKLYNSGGSGVVINMNPKTEDRHTSFFAQPGILAAVIGGAVVGLLCAILVVMFIVYRMRKKDEGSYALDEPKRSPTSNSYSKGNNREFYA